MSERTRHISVDINEVRSPARILAVINGKKFRRLSWALLLILVGLGLYLLLVPFWEDVLLPFRQLTDRTGGYKYQNSLYITDNANIDVSKLAPVPDHNVLVIPRIEVDGEIHEGFADNTLDKGVWRKPLTSTPENGGNTVLTAHRFLYRSGPNTFYHLDKIEPGDTFFIIWNKKEYDYRVVERREVPPTEISVEDNTPEAMVTLYTCTKDAVSRIVVTAKLIN